MVLQLSPFGYLVLGLWIYLWVFSQIIFFKFLDKVQNVWKWKNTSGTCHGFPWPTSLNRGRHHFRNYVSRLRIFDGHGNETSDVGHIRDRSLVFYFIYIYTYMNTYIYYFGLTNWIWKQTVLFKGSWTDTCAAQRSASNVELRGAEKLLEGLAALSLCWPAKPSFR